MVKQRMRNLKGIRIVRQMLCAENINIDGSRLIRSLNSFPAERFFNQMDSIKNFEWLERGFDKNGLIQKTGFRIESPRFCFMDGRTTNNSTNFDVNSSSSFCQIMMAVAQV